MPEHLYDILACAALPAGLVILAFLAFLASRLEI
jgi:hypothetical protein